MSLDVYIISETPIKKSSTGVFIRDNGSSRELEPDEISTHFPDCDENVELYEYESQELYHANITHNMGRMARQIEIEEHTLYDYLWSYEEIREDMLADGLIVPLTIGLSKLYENHLELLKFNPSNGWGSYEDLVNFVENYLLACIKYKNNKVMIWK